MAAAGKSLDQVRDWEPGQTQLSVDDMNTVFAFLRQLKHGGGVGGGLSGIQGSEGLSVAGPGEDFLENWLGQIKDEGPGGQENYFDSRYWIQRVRVKNFLQGDSAARLEFDEFQGGSPHDAYVTATNIAEHKGNTREIIDTHTLAVDQFVYVHEEWDRGVLKRSRRYWINEPPRTMILLECTVRKDGGSAGGVAQKCTFKYECRNPFDNAIYAPNRTPHFGRTAIGRYTAAPNGTMGILLQGAGEAEERYQLIIALEEIPATTVCDCT